MWAFWVVGAGVGIVALGIAVGKGMALGNEPEFTDLSLSKKPDGVNQRCHYCDKHVEPTDKWLRRQCPNCDDFVFYHDTCGTYLHMKQPYCHGVHMGHTTGHTISIKYRNMCAHCGLGKEYWKQQTCTNINPLHHHTRFTEDDEAFLHSMHISIHEVPVEAQ